MDLNQNQTEPDLLEIFVNQHRNDFDIYEPSPKVWEKIQKKQNQPKVVKFRAKYILWNAAAALVIFFAGYYVQYFNSEPQQKAKLEVTMGIQQHTSSKEVSDAESYYSNLVNKKMQEIQKYTVQYPDLVSDVNQDLRQLDSIYNDLKKDLKQNINKEEIVNAMIDNYKIKLQILEDILKSMNKKELAKPNENAKTKSNI